MHLLQADAHPVYARAHVLLPAWKHRETEYAPSPLTRRKDSSPNAARGCALSAFRARRRSPLQPYLLLEGRLRTRWGGRVHDDMESKIAVCHRNSTYPHLTSSASPFAARAEARARQSSRGGRSCSGPPAGSAQVTVAATSGCAPSPPLPRAMRGGPPTVGTSGWCPWLDMNATDTDQGSATGICADVGNNR